MGATNEMLRYVGGTAGPDGDGWVPVINGDDYLHLTTVSPQTVASDVTFQSNVTVDNTLDVAGALTAASVDTAGVEATTLYVTPATDTDSSIELYPRGAPESVQGGQIRFKTVAAAADWDMKLTNVFGVQTMTIGETGNFWPSAILRQNDITLNGPTILTSAGWRENLKVVSGSLGADGAAIGLYAREASKTTRSGIIGYPAAGATHLDIDNQISGGYTRLLVGGAARVTAFSSGVQLDGTDINLNGLTYGAEQIRAFNSASGQSFIAASNLSSAYVGMYPDAVSATNLGTRHSYMGVSSGHLRLWNETTNSFIIFGTENSETARLTSVNLLVGKTGSGLAVGGAEIFGTGTYYSTLNGGNNSAANYYANRRGNAVATSRPYIMFAENDSGVGSITRAGAATTAYNTTSDGELKGNVVDLDEEEAIATIEAWRPVAFQWRIADDGSVRPDAEPSGEVEHGFIAQEMYEVSPQAIAKGEGSFEDHLAWQEQVAEQAKQRDELFVLEAIRYILEAQKEEEIAAWKQECQRIADTWEGEGEPDLPPEPEPLNLGPAPEVPEVPPSPWRPWGGDWKVIVPDIAAGMRWLIRRSREQAERIEALEAKMNEE